MRGGHQLLETLTDNGAFLFSFGIGCAIVGRPSPVFMMVAGLAMFVTGFVGTVLRNMGKL